MENQTPATTEITVRTEDGCTQTFKNDREVKVAKRWSPARTFKKKAGLLDAGDYIDTPTGWSSIAEISRK